MHDDPAQYWRDLTDHYRRMSDGELLELAGKPEDLTEVAQQVLGDEMKLRQLTSTKSAPKPARTRNEAAAIHTEPTSYRYEFSRNDLEEKNGSYEYTWKTELCECETAQQAWQLAEALRRAGIDTWIQTSRATADVMDVTYPRIFVAADQLDEAQAVAAQPIPQDIIDQSKQKQETGPEDFDVPVCPKCGAADPVLCPASGAEAGDSNPGQEGWVNLWLCEACGAEWTDPEPGAYEDLGTGRP